MTPKLPSDRYFPSRRGSGLAIEARAREFLHARGLRFVEAGFYCKVGEIDLVFQDGPELVFVEVRMRREGFAWESAIESVGFGKLRRLELAIRFYLLRREGLLASLGVRSMRLDVLGFDGAEFEWRQAIEFPRSGR